AFLEKIGFVVQWDGVANTVTATADGTVMTVVAGTNKLSVNGNVTDMPCNATIIDGTTYLPVRAVGESAGYTVNWLAATKSAVLTNGSDKYKYYDDTPSLLPELGSVAGGAVFEAVLEDTQNGGVYYVYKNYVEDKAHQYGDILCNQFGYEYDSMQLGQNYSKLYNYTIDDVQTVVAVATVEGVPYIYIYPDVSGKHLPENNASDLPESGRDNSGFTGAQYYGDTLVPTFEYICGRNAISAEQLESGTMYVYEGSTFEMMDYVSGLMSFGFMQYDVRMGDMFEMTYTFVKDDDYVVVSSSMLFRQIYVLPIDNIKED
ncbi:MAG: copper amine oxidase N-terminal domain-containing protein, partial [Clostridia bacterium]|nr:copper amine oxidase N-terminal domain-containing protein [Clostridia bacterium]